MGQGGACSASANATMRASGASPRSSARCADMTTSAHAPSLSDEELAAVTVPTSAGLNAGRSEAILSIFTLVGSSSMRTTCRPARQ